MSIPAQHLRYNAVMSVVSDSARPLLVLVSGKPGSGKSTLAGRRVNALSLPLVSRDALKGGLAETLGGMGDAATLDSVGVFYGAITYLLDVGVPTLRVETTQAYASGLDAIIAFGRGNPATRVPWASSSRT